MERSSKRGRANWINQSVTGIKPNKYQRGLSQIWCLNIGACHQSFSLLHCGGFMTGCQGWCGTEMPTGLKAAKQYYSFTIQSSLWKHILKFIFNTIRTTCWQLYKTSEANWWSRVIFYGSCDAGAVHGAELLQLTVSPVYGAIGFTAIIFLCLLARDHI